MNKVFDKWYWELSTFERPFGTAAKIFGEKSWNEAIDRAIKIAEKMEGSPSLNEELEALKK